MSLGFLIGLLLTSSIQSCLASGDYLNEWAVYVPAGEEVATTVARDLGYENKGQIGSLDGYYLFVRSSHPRRTKRAAHLHTRSLSADNRVEWAEQQYHLKRTKRDNLIAKRDEEMAYRNTKYMDDFWPQQWYLFDTRESDNLPKMDLHVVPLWKKNLTGNGVVVTILDDGLEHNHTDLQQNYDPDASYDFNDEDGDPFPRYDPNNENKHGTRCAGEVAMVANNGKCGVGVAYNSRIGGIRMLDGTVTDSLEARALTHNIDHIDIISASWGPNDDGQTLERPGRLGRAAFEKGATLGRGGKGIIYVWASGNGGFHKDNCDCDGYTGSIYTLSISSASEQSKSPWYAEHCASTMATTYSSGAFSDQKIISTDLHNTCTSSHTGTSASAPLAAGIFALVLEVNPALTWRDVQHLVAWTSEYAPLQNNPGWKRNAAGFWLNERFGFGLLNAVALANAADPTVFKTVPEKTVCLANADLVNNLPQSVTSASKLEITITTDGCQGQQNEVNYLEHLILTLDMDYSTRGNLAMYLTSPQGTVTELLAKRPWDKSDRGFSEWPFMSVHNWGENPAGTWVFTVIDDTQGYDKGAVVSVGLAFHGTREIPDHVTRAGGKRVYNMNYNNVHNTRKTAEDADLVANESDDELLSNKPEDKVNAEDIERADDSVRADYGDPMSDYDKEHWDKKFGNLNWKDYLISFSRKTRISG